MKKIIKAEFLKGKKTTTNKLVVITPLFTVLLSLLLGGGQLGAYNWWYTMLLPGSLTIISAQVMTKEKNLSYKGIFLCPQGKGSIWLGKVYYVSLLFIISCLIFMLVVGLVGFFLPSPITWQANLLATLVLILTFLFTIPISLFLTVNLHMFVALAFNMGMTIASIVAFATNSFLKSSPYGMPARSMVPILRLLPNGLPLEGDVPSLAGNFLARGIAINIIVFIGLAILTRHWFEKKEVE